MTDRGMTVNRVLITPGTSPRFALVAGRYGIECSLFFHEDMQKQDAPEQVGYDAIDILAVEDNEVNQLVLHQILEALGISFRIVESGSAAIDEIDDLNPRIVLADITLPDMSLSDFGHKIAEKCSEKNRRVPLISVAPADNAQMRKASAEAGFDDMLVKPLSPESVDAALRRHLFGVSQIQKNLPKSVA